MAPVVVSAPGKVLVTGAYLVLEAPNPGLVLSTSARFYAAASPLDCGAGPQAPAVIEVASPQLRLTTRYCVQVIPSPSVGSPKEQSGRASASLELSTQDGSPGSPYLSRALSCALHAALLVKHGRVDDCALAALLADATSGNGGNRSAGFRLVVAGDNDFYSQRAELAARDLPLSSSSLPLLPRFAAATQNQRVADKAVSGGASQGSATTAAANAAPAAAPDRSKDAPTSAQAAPPLLPEVAKTGLGSSAALVTSVVGVVLAYLNVIGGQGEGAAGDCYRGDKDEGPGGDSDLAKGVVAEAGAGEAPCAGKATMAHGGPGRAAAFGDGDRQLVHRVAQLAHCLAQGKVGSGFDVAAAVFGSQQYVRFSPRLLGGIADVAPHQMPELVSRLVQLPGQPPPAPWDGQRCPLALPRGLLLMVGEPGTGGTSTPSMVGGIQAWRKKEAAAAAALWASLARANADVEAGLRSLGATCGALGDAAYDGAMTTCARLHASQWRELSQPPPPGVGDRTRGSDSNGDCNRTGSDAGMAACRQVAAQLSDVWEGFARVRALLRDMGERAGVPVEPPSQTRLLDATAALEGVLLAGVPGAGGYDAVFAITLGAEARGRVEAEWARWQVLALCAQEDAVGLRMEPPCALEGTALMPQPS